jgi:hypothetical protein
MNKPTIRELQKLATRLGFRGMKSFAELYRGGTLTAFGHKENSAPTFWIHLTTDYKVESIEVHKTYFQPTVQIINVNEFVADSPKTIKEVIIFLNNKFG